MNEEHDDLPQLDTVFEAPGLVFDDHDWQQQGYSVIDVCNPKKSTCMVTSLAIPVGMLLVKDKGGHYQLVDEITRK